MNWIFIALLEPILHAAVNILDSNLANRLFKSAWLLTILIAFSTILFLPIVFVLDPPQIPPLSLVPYIVIVGLIELFYSYPYFKALQNDDTSVAISLFSLGKIFVPILAFIFIKESLLPIQYFGFAVIIISSFALTFNPKEKFKINKSFFYMLVSSSMLAVEVIIYKYIFDQVNWGTGLIGAMSISGLVGISTILLPKVRQNLKTELPTLKKYYWVILLIAGIGFVGNIGFTYAVSVVSPTVARSIDSFQPMFVLLYAVIFKRFFPISFKEEIDAKSLGKKILLFIVTVIGVALTIK